MSAKQPKPFWQTVVLTLITSVATGVGTYYAAKQDTAEPAQVAQQSVRVDMVWDACKALHESLEGRVTRLEDSTLLPGTMPLGESRAEGGMGTAPAVDLMPPEELFGDADAEEPDPSVSVSTPPPAAQPPTKAGRKALPKRIPTPPADDPRVNAAQRAWGK